MSPFAASRLGRTRASPSNPRFSAIARSSAGPAADGRPCAAGAGHRQLYACRQRLDRRHGPGGHWNDAYPFVRLHQPSAFYGVPSRNLGEDRIAHQLGVGRPRRERRCEQPVEADVDVPDESPLFQRYPELTVDHHLMENDLEVTR